MRKALTMTEDNLIRCIAAEPESICIVPASCFVAQKKMKNDYAKISQVFLPYQDLLQGIAVETPRVFCSDCRLGTANGSPYFPRRLQQTTRCRYRQFSHEKLEETAI